MAEYNSDELVAPDWLNSDFFLDVLRKTQNDPTITLSQDCSLRPGTKPGDHYASVMFRTTAHYRSNRLKGEHALHMVIKIMPTAEGVKAEILKDNSLFNTEIRMYTEILPVIAKILKDAGETFEFPRFLYYSHQPKTIIILEDCNVSGWLTGRDFINSYEEILPTVLNLAKIHAASYFLHETRALDLSSFRFTVLTDGALDSMYESFDGFCDAVQKWDDCKEFGSKFLKLKHTSKEKIQAVYTPNPSGVGYNVLNHGDCQCKNLLHKRNSENQITDSMLLDYQACHWGSPAIDLICLLDNVGTHDVRRQFRGKIIYAYYQHFAEILQKVGHVGTVPTLCDLQVELLRKGFLEVFHGVVFEIFYAIELKENTLEDFASSESWEIAFKSKKYQQIIQSIMPRLMLKGNLD